MCIRQQSLRYALLNISELINVDLQEVKSLSKRKFNFCFSLSLIFNIISNIVVSQILIFCYYYNTLLTFNKSALRIFNYHLNPHPLTILSRYASVLYPTNFLFFAFQLINLVNAINVKVAS